MDPIYGKLAATAVEKAAKNSAKEVSSPLQNSDSPFKQMLQEMDIGQDMAKMLGMGQETSLGAGKMEAISADGIKLDPSEMNVGLEEPKGAEKIVDMLSEVNKGQMQMDNLVNEILYSGKKFSNQELLAIQAHVFHFAQMTELTVKVAEQGVSSVKTVLNTQVQ
jgi:type I site-specific restriction-modification system R (restriction) subunit